MTSHQLVNQIHASIGTASCNLRVPAGSIAMAEIRAYRAADLADAMGCMKGRTPGTTEASWLHTPKFGPNHHSQRWRPAT